MHLVDDGCGIHPEEMLPVRGEHFSLAGMRERVERLGGSYRDPN
jgi:signal transduction histidine kinase